MAGFTFASQFYSLSLSLCSTQLHSSAMQLNAGCQNTKTLFGALHCFLLGLQQPLALARPSSHKSFAKYIWTFLVEYFLIFEGKTAKYRKKDNKIFIRLTTTLGTWQTISPQICSIGHLPLQITIVRTRQIYVSQCLDKYSTPRIASWIHALRIQPSWTHALWNGYIAVMNYEYIGLGFTSICLKVPRG